MTLPTDRSKEPTKDRYPEIGHVVNDYMPCPKCGAKEFEVRNYDLLWHDGDVHCACCGTYVRSYDAG